MPKELPACNFQRFNEHHRRVASILSSLTSTSEDFAVNSLRLEVSVTASVELNSPFILLQINGVISYDSYEACQAFADSLLTSEREQQTVFTDRCVSDVVRIGMSSDLTF